MNATKKLFPAYKLLTTSKLSDTNRTNIVTQYFLYLKISQFDTKRIEIGFDNIHFCKTILMFLKNK